MNDKVLIRNVIIGASLFTAWLATGTLLSATHPPAWYWMGYIQAAAVEGVLWYAINAVIGSNQKLMLWLVILLFGAASYGAQILSAYLNAPALPREDTLPGWVLLAWRYLLPGAPVMAALAFGVIDAVNDQKVGTDVAKLLERLPELLKRSTSDSAVSGSLGGSQPPVSGTSASNGKLPVSETEKN